VRICYYAQVDLSGESGSIGSVRHVVEIVNRLSDRGQEVVVFVPEPSSEPEKLSADRVHYFLNLPGIRGFVLGLVHCLILMVREYCNEPPDLIYAREMLYTVHTTLFSRVFNIPQVMEINGFQPEELPMDEEFQQVLYPVLIGTEALNYWMSTHLISVSPSIRDRIVDFYRVSDETVTCIRNGVNTDRCRPMNDVECRRRLDLPEDGYFVGFIGYLFPWSGVEYLIRAAPDVLAVLPNTKFVVVGSGEWGDHLPELARNLNVMEQFYFTGKAPWSEVPVYLNTFDVGVSPYPPRDSLGDSLKTYEYMACGLPVVVSDISGLREVVESGRAGLTFEPANCVQLADKIVELGQNPSLREAMGRRARKHVKKHYDWKISAEKTQKLLETVYRS